MPKKHSSRPKFVLNYDMIFKPSLEIPMKLKHKLSDLLVPEIDKAIERVVKRNRREIEEGAEQAEVAFVLNNFAKINDVQ